MPNEIRKKVGELGGFVEQLTPPVFKSGDPPDARLKGYRLISLVAEGPFQDRLEHHRWFLFVTAVVGPEKGCRLVDRLHFAKSRECMKDAPPELGEVMLLDLKETLLEWGVIV